MPFRQIPITSTYIDVSEIEDLERERLKVTFNNGNSLLFRVDIRYGRAAPRLLVDVGEAGSPSYFTARNLRAELFDQFRRDRYDRTWANRAVDSLHKLFNSDFRPRYDGWSVSRLFEEFFVELPLGDQYRACGLVVGQTLQLHYGTYFSDPASYYLSSWGIVTEVESIVLQPTSFRTVARQGAGAEM